MQKKQYKRRTFLKTARFGMSALFLPTFGIENSKPEQKPNVLFIAIDDLNDWVGCMAGHPDARTPNIDRLAESGTLFQNAHCQAPLCGPSRTSLMTGLLPSTTGVYGQIRDRHLKKVEPVAEATFLSEYFEHHGYHTMGVGKLFHKGGGDEAFQEYGGVYEKFGRD